MQRLDSGRLQALVKHQDACRGCRVVRFTFDQPRREVGQPRLSEYWQALICQFHVVWHVYRRIIISGQPILIIFDSYERKPLYLVGEHLATTCVLIDAVYNFCLCHDYAVIIEMIIQQRPCAPSPSIWVMADKICYQQVNLAYKFKCMSKCNNWILRLIEWNALVLVNHYWRLLKKHNFCWLVVWLAELGFDTSNCNF